MGNDSTGENNEQSESGYDGRHARRTRNRSQVIWSYVDLLREGNGEPTRDTVANKAGVSTRSTYRYFPNDDDLIAAVADYVVASFHPELSIPTLGEGTLHQRIGSFVDSRLSMYKQTAPITRAGRFRRTDDPHVASAFDRVRAATRDQLSQHFAAELDGMDADQHARAITAMHSPFLFDSIEYMYRTHADDAVVREVLCRQLRATLLHGMAEHRSESHQ